MRALLLRTWKMATIFAVVGGVLGAAYAYYRAARVRIVVNLRPVDQMPVYSTPRRACAELIDAKRLTREQLQSRGMATDTDVFTPGNCFESTKALFRSDLEGNSLFLEYERGDEKGFAMVNALRHSPHEIDFLAKQEGGLPKPSVIEPIFAGVAAALLFAACLQIVCYAAAGRFS
jgi:hypothetical protein